MNDMKKLLAIFESGNDNVLTEAEAPKGMTKKQWGGMTKKQWDKEEGHDWLDKAVKRSTPVAKPKVGKSYRTSHRGKKVVELVGTNRRKIATGKMATFWTLKGEDGKEVEVRAENTELFTESHLITEGVEDIQSEFNAIASSPEATQSVTESKGSTPMNDMKRLLRLFESGNNALLENDMPQFGDNEELPTQHYEDWPLLCSGGDDDDEITNPVIAAWDVEKMTSLKIVGQWVDDHEQCLAIEAVINGTTYQWSDWWLTMVGVKFYYKSEFEEGEPKNMKALTALYDDHISQSGCV